MKIVQNPSKYIKINGNSSKSTEIARACIRITSASARARALHCYVPIRTWFARFTCLTPLSSFLIISKSKSKRPRRFVSRCPEELLHMARESWAGGIQTTSDVKPRLAKSPFPKPWYPNKPLTLNPKP